MTIKESLKIIRVPIPTPTLWPHTTTNCYLIGNEHESILVDAGYDIEETKTTLESVIAEHGLARPEKVILTHFHPDHAPGVKRLMEWSPIIFCHINEKQGTLAAISPYQELSFLSDGELMEVDHEEIMILHTPGHTAGHLNVYIPSSGTLIAGDNIVAEGTTWIGPPDGDMGDYLHTLNRLKNLKLARIGPGHGDWVVKPYEQIDFVINRRLFREKQIVSLLKDYKQLTSKRLTELIYKNSIHPSVFEVARLTTEAHLIKLIKEGAVSINDSNLYTLKKI